MLDLKFIRENPDVIRWAIQVKNVILDFDRLLALDAEVRSTRHKSEQLAAQRRRLADRVRTAAPEQQQNLGEQSRQLAAKLKVLGEELARLEGQLGELMLLVPNVPDKSAPVGPDAESNVVVARWGEPPQFDFPMKDHVDLAQRNNWVDLKRVTEVCGNRTYCLKNRLAQLEFVLLTMTMQRMVGEGFTLLTVPSIAREAAFVGTGHFPTGRTEVYELPEDSLFLSGGKKAPRAQKKPAIEAFFATIRRRGGWTVPTPGTRSICHAPTYVWNDHKFLECPEIVVSSSRCHRPQMSFFADSFRGDPHGTDPKFVRITEVFSLQFFGGTGGAGGTPRDLMLQRWYQPVGPVFANFVFMVVPPVSPISTTIISIMCLQYPRYHRYQPECVGALAGMSCNKRSRRGPATTCD